MKRQYFPAKASCGWRPIIYGRKGRRGGSVSIFNRDEFHRDTHWPVHLEEAPFSFYKRVWFYGLLLVGGIWLDSVISRIRRNK